MSPQPSGAILTNGGHVDLSSRFQQTTTVVASPAGATETIIASLTISSNLTINSGIRLRGWAAFTVGTNGTTYELKIRRTNTSGATQADTGAIGTSATSLVANSVVGNDTGATLPGQVYVLTLTVANGSAASTVSAVSLEAVVV
jgi:hypothetical protein